MNSNQERSTTSARQLFFFSWELNDVSGEFFGVITNEMSHDNSESGFGGNFGDCYFWKVMRIVAFVIVVEKLIAL